MLEPINAYLMTVDICSEFRSINYNRKQDDYHCWDDVGVFHCSVSIKLPQLSPLTPGVPEGVFPMAWSKKL